MFLFNELIFLLPLIIYACLRIARLIPGRLGKIGFTVFFIFIVAGYPVAETLSHGAGPGWTKVLILAGYYCLPFMLYFVLIVILSDFVIAALRLLNMMSRETAGSPRFRAGLLSFLLGAPALIVILGIVNYRHLQVRAYSIEVPRKSSSIEHLKIVFAADFHLGQITAGRLMEGFVEKVNALDPDLVLIGGDILEGDRRDEDASRFEAQFRRIRAKYGVYGVPGNHESHSGRKSDLFEKAGIRLLQDAVEKIDEAFYLAGRNDGHSGSRMPVAELLRDTPDDLPVILMDHRPVDFDAVSRSIADIQLSGHTHNGQLFPINLITRRRYELSWGYLKKRQTHFFVTSGIQLWGPPVRTAGASEVLAIDVVFR